MIIEISCEHIRATVRSVEQADDPAQAGQPGDVFHFAADDYHVRLDVAKLLAETGSLADTFQAIQSQLFAQGAQQ